MINKIMELTKLANIKDSKDDTIKYYVKHKIFFERFSQIFYHSKKLLNSVITPYLSDIYLKDINYTTNNIQKTDETFNTQVEIDHSTLNKKTETAEYITKQVYNFLYKKENYKIFLQAKYSGLHFGGKYECTRRVEKCKCDKIGTYFLKAFHGYPARNNKGSGQTMLDTKNSITTTSFRNGDDARIHIGRLDLKEPFTYKVMEALNYGPKTHFLINPYIRNGFYIVTKDLSTKNMEFRLANSLDFDENKEEITNYLEEKKFRTPPQYFIDLNELTFFISIADITDIKTDNFGLITERKEQETKKIFPEEIKEWKIIDFLNASSYNDYDVESRFINGKIVYETKTSSITDQMIRIGVDATKKSYARTIEVQRLRKLYSAKQSLINFEKRLNNYKSTHEDLFKNNEEIENKPINDETIFKTLLNEQAQLVKNLMLQKRNEPILNNRTNAEVIGFSIDNEAEDNLPKLDRAFNDLDKYTNKILENYRILKKYITDSYEEDFDNEGNLK